MQPSLSRKLARRVMALALFISPPASREWAEAMAAELDYVNGSFKALSWSIGCLGAALKQLCISILSPGAFAVETEGPVSKFAKISAAALIVASALFLFAPTFRQGLTVTAGSWRQSDSSWLETMKNLGAKAEAAHDAQALAFVAIQLRYQTQDRVFRDKYADEAVAWDPQLAWIYFPLLSSERIGFRKHPDPNQARWLARLQAWDPSNAAVYSLEASFDSPPGALGWNSATDQALLSNSPGWLDGMAKAFSAASYDSYMQRTMDLERAVTHREGRDDPGRALLGMVSYPLPELSDFHLYSRYFLMKSGADSESKGDLKHAEEAYGKIVHIGQLIELYDSTDIEDLVGIGLQKSAGPHLEEVLGKSGNPTAANLVAFQIALGDAVASQIRTEHDSIRLESELRPFDAYVLQASLLGMAVSLLLILFYCIYLVVRRILRSSGTSRLFTVFGRTGITGAILLFLSVFMMYFGYLSYAAAFQNYLAAKNVREAHASLTRFVMLEELPSELFDSSQRIYLWYAVIVVGIAVIAWILFRHLARTLHRPTPVRPPA